MDLPILPVLIVSILIIGIVIKIWDSWKKWDRPAKTEPSDDPYAYWDDLKPPRGPRGHGGGFGGGMS